MNKHREETSARQGCLVAIKAIKRERVDVLKGSITYGYRSILSNFSVALGAQGLSTLVGLLTSLIVPKLLGVADFGYWQLFIFYTTYLSLFTLGLNDGVYLIEGGKRRDETNKKQLASQFWVECGYQFIFAGIIVA